MKKRLMLFGLLLVMMVFTQFLFVDQAEGTKIYFSPPNGFVSDYFGSPACRLSGKQCWVSNGVGPGTGQPIAAEQAKKDEE